MEEAILGKVFRNKSNNQLSLTIPKKKLPEFLKDKDIKEIKLILNKKNVRW